MRLDPWTLVAIAGMALVSYACRGGGYWLFRRIRPSPVLRDMLGTIPGALFVSYVVPKLVDGGAWQWVGAAVTLGLTWRFGNLAVAVIGGTAAGWAVWAAM